MELTAIGQFAEKFDLESKRTSRMRMYALLVLVDSFAVISGFVIAGAVRFESIDHGQGWLISLIVIPLFLALNSRGYSLAALSDWRSALVPTLGAFALAISIVLFVEFYVRAAEQLSRLVVGSGMVAASAALVAGRALVGSIAHRVLRGEPLSRVLILDKVDRPAPSGVSVLRTDGLKLEGHIDQPFVLDWLARSLEGADYIHVACPPERRAEWVAVFKATDFRVDLLVPELDEIGALGGSNFDGSATITISSGRLRVRDEFAKRVFDLVISIPTLIFLGPLLLFVSIAIKLDSPGPVFFRQTRVGQGNRLFSVFKFRSMRDDASDSTGALSTQRDDARVTRVGRFIRATSIDELPQIFNIVRGEMSFVGPRPHALGSTAGEQLFWQVDPRYWHRHACKPGLTGLAQIRGFRGATHRREDLINRLQADLEYVNGWSVWRDLSIMLATVRVLVHRNAF